MMINLLDDTLFDHLPEPIALIKANSPYFAIVKCNQQFKVVSRTENIDIIGKSMTELHRWNPENEESALLIHDSLNEVITKKETIRLPAVRYDLPSIDGLETEQHWWQTSYEPILDAEGQVEYLLCTTVNITGQQLGKG